MKVLIDQDMNVQVLLDSAIALNNNLVSSKEEVYVEGGMDGMMIEGGMDGGMGVEQPKDPLLSNWIFVIGISVLSLAVSVGLGILLAKRKIKKGFELYEN